MGIYSKKYTDELWRVINRDNPSPLPFTDANSRVKNIRVLSVGGFNTAADIEGIKNAGYRGIVPVQYNRIELGKLFLKNRPVLTKYNPTKISDFLIPLANRYGIYLTAADIEDGPIDQSNAPGTLVIQVKAGNPLYVGAIGCDWDVALPSLREILPQQELSELRNMIAPYDANRQRSTLLCLGADASEHFAALNSISWSTTWQNRQPSGLAGLLSVLQAITIYPWRVNASGVAGQYNLTNGSCYYRGKLSDMKASVGWVLDELLVPTWATHVLVYSFNVTYCTNLDTTSLLVFYRVPEGI